MTTEKNNHFDFGARFEEGIQAMNAGQPKGQLKYPLDYVSEQIVRDYFDPSGGGGAGNVFGQIRTTDATPVAVDIFAFTARGVCLAELRIAAQRTNGTSGVEGDAAVFLRRAGYKRNSSGSAPALMTMIQDAFTHRDQSTWDADFTVDGNNLQIQVTGASGNDITWNYFVSTYSLL